MCKKCDLSGSYYSHIFYQYYLHFLSHLATRDPGPAPKNKICIIFLVIFLYFCMVLYMLGLVPLSIPQSPEQVSTPCHPPPPATLHSRLVQFAGVCVFGAVPVLPFGFAGVSCCLEGRSNRHDGEQGSSSPKAKAMSSETAEDLAIGTVESNHLNNCSAAQQAVEQLLQCFEGEDDCEGVVQTPPKI